MKTNSKIRKNQNTSSTANGSAPKSPRIPSAGNLEPLQMTIDYSSMYEEVEKIKDAMTFDELKAFYSMP